MGLVARARIVPWIGFAVEDDERHDHGRGARRDVHGVRCLEPDVAVELEVAHPVSVLGGDHDLQEMHTTVGRELGQVRENVRVEEVRDRGAIGVTAHVVAAEVSAVSRDAMERVAPGMGRIEDRVLSKGRDQRW
jgi:hypothetical protein